jgi:L-rhamnose mutarotase
MMQRKCFLLKVKPDRLRDYLRAHDPVWPEMLDALRQAGIRNYSMFYRPDGLLVGYLEGDDIAASLKRVGETEANARWQAHMAEYFEGGSGDMEKGGLQWLEPYFHTD